MLGGQSIAPVRNKRPDREDNRMQKPELFPLSVYSIRRKIRQNRYTGRHIADALSMGDEGYVFVPAACEQGAACRVHIALHGCKQDAGTIGRLFIEQTGYNAWADANGIIVLYPQAKARRSAPRSVLIKRRGGHRAQPRAYLVAAPNGSESGT